MSQGWTTIFMGPVGEAEALRARIEAKGIPAFIPDDAIRTLDPFETGGLLVFDRAVQVPSSAVEAARACLEESDDESEIRPGEQELPADFFEDQGQADAAQLTRVYSCSRRVLWGAILALGAPMAMWRIEPRLCLILPIAVPFALWQIRSYSSAVKRLGRKPPLYRWTLAAGWCAPVCLLGYFAQSVVYTLRR